MSCLTEFFLTAHASVSTYGSFIITRCYSTHLDTCYYEEAIKKRKNADTISKEKDLVKAVLENNHELFSASLASGVAPDVPEYNEFLRTYINCRVITPLQYLAARGDGKRLELLIKHGANVNEIDAFGVTATHLAAEQGNDKILVILLEHGAVCIPTKAGICISGHAVPFYGGTTALHLAASNDHILCLKILMQYGVDYNEVDEKGRTALYIAAEQGFNGSVMTLLKNAIGQDILSLPDKKFGYTPLHLAVKNGMLQSVKELLRMGSDVNHMGIDGYSPFHMCFLLYQRSSSLAMQILKLLILFGYNADVNQKDRRNKTPLHYVSFNDGNIPPTRVPEMAKFLLAFGADASIFDRTECSLLNNEFNRSYGDLIILKAVLDSMEFRPRIVMQNRDEIILPDPFNRGMLNVPVVFVKNDERGQHLETWFRDSYPQVPTLKHISRIRIRKEMGANRLRGVEYLPIPRVLKSYLLLGVEL